MPKCPELVRLQSEVESVLGRLAQVTNLQLELFRSGQMHEWKRLDNELELPLARKSDPSAL